jgi:hypothetical protein
MDHGVPAKNDGRGCDAAVVVVVDAAFVDAALVGAVPFVVRGGVGGAVGGTGVAAGVGLVVFSAVGVPRFEVSEPWVGVGAGVGGCDSDDAPTSGRSAAVPPTAAWGPAFDAVRTGGRGADAPLGPPGAPAGAALNATLDAALDAALVEGAGDGIVDGVFGRAGDGTVDDAAVGIADAADGAIDGEAGRTEAARIAAGPGAADAGAGCTPIAARFGIGNVPVFVGLNARISSARFLFPARS